MTLGSRLIVQVELHRVLRRPPTAAGKPRSPRAWNALLHKVYWLRSAVSWLFGHEQEGSVRAR